MTWAKLPVKLRIYISFLSILGSFVFIWAVFLANYPQDNNWIVLAVLVVFTLPLTLLLDKAGFAIGIGDAYIMAIAMMYDVAPCIIATFVQILAISVFGQRRRVRPYKVIFNTASTICCAWLYGTIYHLINKSNSVQLQDIIVPAALLVAAYFFSNSILTSISIAWSTGESILSFWAKACMPLAVDYSISAICATGLVALKGVAWWVPLAAAPAIFVVWAWSKFNKARIIQAEKHLDEQKQLYRRTVESLALAVDAKDQTTYGHIRRVKAYAMGLAKLCGIKDQNELDAIENGSLLHDIGKLAVDDYILNKPGRLTQTEFNKVKIHADAGHDILQQVCFPYPVAKYVRYHHERWDGLGYPDGLKGVDIPLGARILAIADAFDAIRFSRPYKLSVSTEEALEILRAQAETYYDPNLVRIFTEHIGELEQTAIKESEDAPQLSFRKYSEKAEIGAPDVTSLNQKIFRDIPAELVQLAELCSALPGYLRLNDILPILSRRLEQLVPFSTCVFYLNNDDNHIVATHITGRFSEVLKGHEMEMGKGISGWVAAYRRPMINTGPLLDFHGIDADFTSLTDALVVPILHRDQPLGTISLYSQEPGSYGQYEMNIVQTLASLLAPLIAEAKRNGGQESQDVVDPTTQLRRISYLTAIGPQLLYSAGQNRTPISLIYIEIKNLGQITRVFGSSFGNSMIKKISDCVQPELRETDILVRYGHQAFVAFLPGVRDEQAFRCVERLKQQIKSEALTPGQGFAIDLQAGISYYPKDGSTVLALLQAAQENMQLGSLDKSASGSNVVEFIRG